MEKQKFLIIGLSIALILTLQYVIIDKWTNSINQDILQNSQDAYNQGVLDTMITIYQQTENCQPTPIKIGNLTKVIFDLACLNPVQNP